MEEKLNELFDEFVDKVSQAVSEEFGEEPKQEDLWLGTYNRGVGTRISITERFSVDLTFDQLEEIDEDELDDEYDEDEEEQW